MRIRLSLKFSNPRKLEHKEEHLEIIKLQNLRLAAKIISEKLIQGSHFGKRVGSGAEFEQYRHYEPGDDLKRLDWKLFARSEKYLIKESPVDSYLNIKLILDLSGSMNYEEDGIQRLKYAKILFASIAYLAYMQEDRLSLYFLKNGKVEQMTSVNAKSFHAILYHLESAEAKGNWPIEVKTFPELKSKEKELVIMVSDFLQEENEWTSIVKSMVHPRKNILLFQILGANEIEMNLEGNRRFVDLESGNSIHANASDLVKEYNLKMTDYLKGLDLALQFPGVNLHRVSLEEPIAEVLEKVLKQKFLS